MRVACLVASFALILAGCSDGKADKPSGADDFDDLGAQATATTGIILGVVVDDTITPLGEAAVTITQNGRSAVTDGQGRFAFADLEPGTYFLQVSKFGYSTQQADVEVVAGVSDPDIERIQLLRDVTVQPYHAAQTQTGYILCTTSVAAVCGAANLASNLILCDVFQVCLGDLTSDRFGLSFYFEPNATVIQGEMFWDSTQPITPELTLSAENLGASAADTCPPPSLSDGTTYYEITAGGSPIFIRTEADEVAAGEISATCPIFYSVFSQGVTPDVPVGVTVQQAFEIFTDAFYGYAPPEDWRFSQSPAPAAPI